MVRFLLSLVIGLVIGVIVGLYLGWFQFPVEYLDSPIGRLDPQYRDTYTVMIANGYRSDGDALAAIERLRVLGVADVPDFVFQQAERYIANSRDLGEIRALIALSEGLGRTSPQFDSYRQATVPEGGMNAQIPRDSRYYRPRRALSWGALIFGILAGLAGGLYWAWQVAPVEETDTAPWQLNAQSRANYVVAIMVNYGYDSDLGAAVSRLLDLRPPGDPVQYVADIACDLARSGYVDSASGERAIRTMMTFYRNQGRAGCADQLIPLFVGPTPTPQSTVFEIPTLPPPPTKTATPPPDPNEQGSTPVRVVPTVAPQGAFDIVRLERFCDADTPGIIVVQVQERDGTPLPGQRVRASWRDGESVFVTGLKPERGRDYADFTMEPGVGYTVDMPGQSDPSQVVTSEICNGPTGQDTYSSYRVVFRPSF